MKKNLKIKAFTLVELAIVLVIIGLLTAGVMGGQSLIESSKRQKVISEFRSYKTAVKAFQLEYDGLPGDLKDATAYWGTAADCEATVPTTTETCNGDNDGKIDYMNSVDSTWENWRAWQHLSSAGIISGKYTGANSGDVSILGTNIPKGAHEGGGWHLFTIEGWGWGASISRSTVLVYGGHNAGSSIWFNGILTPKDAKAIDTKVDDGMPFSGKTIDMLGTNPSYTPGCATTDNSITSDYALTDTDKECILFFSAD